MTTFLNSVSRTTILFSVCMMTFVLSGCNPSKSRLGSALNLDTDLRINFIVDADVNPDENKRASPVFIRLYELKSSTVFMKSDFIDLYEKDTEILGGDFLNKQILKPLSPSVKRTDTFVLKNGATQIGIYAEFSQYRGSVHKLSFPIVEHNVKTKEVTVKISGTDISIVKK
jgi:type VI secretion system protein VasD